MTVLNKEIIPAIIATSAEDMGKRLEKVKAHTGWFQLDIMDGVFVKSHSLDFDFRLPEGKFEAHLMISDPESWVRMKGDMVDTVLAHIESCKDPEELIRISREKGKRVGFALNPGTPVEMVKPYLDRIDQVLVMTVDPGFYGSKFLPDTLRKVRELRKLAPELDIEVDGSINTETIRLAAEAGANIFVSGSFIMESDDAGAAIAALKKEVGLSGQD